MVEGVEFVIYWGDTLSGNGVPTEVASVHTKMFIDHLVNGPVTNGTGWHRTVTWLGSTSALSERERERGSSPAAATCWVSLLPPAAWLCSRVREVPDGLRSVVHRAPPELHGEGARGRPPKPLPHQVLGQSTAWSPQAGALALRQQKQATLSCLLNVWSLA